MKEKLLSFFSDLKSYILSELPTLITLIILSSVCTMLMLRYVPQFKVQPNVVVFDVVKLSNSQKRVMASLMKDPNNTDVLLAIKGMGQKVRAAIFSEVDDNTIVLIKQSVVAGIQVRDITDNVLAKLGLPTDVPSENIQLDYNDALYRFFNENELIKQERLRLGLPDPATAEKIAPVEKTNSLLIP